MLQRRVSRTVPEEPLLRLTAPGVAAAAYPRIPVTVVAPLDNSDWMR